MSKLLLFFWAVTNHWAVLMTGGVLTACLMVLEYWLEKPFSWRIYRWVIAVFIVAACFLAWRDEYNRAEGLLKDHAILEGRLREKERQDPQDHLKAIESLQSANAQLETKLRTTEQTLSALQYSLRPRRLSVEERQQFTDALMRHDGQPFGTIDVVTGLGCQECMIYQDEIISTINSIPGWSARGVVEVRIRADLTGLVIGVQDAKASLPGAQILADAFEAAGLVVATGTVDFLSPDRFILIIGNKP